jgi:peptidoglycan/LPS O-acetylase OafA/YrhL
MLNVTLQTEKFYYLFCLGAFFAVDVFFFIGGFLVAYSFMREKSKSILKYPFAILHRVLRFWPSYIFTIIIYSTIYIHTGEGPLWWLGKTLGQIDFCDDFWKTIFFMDNLIDNGERMCLGWGWYLQNDMQIFIVSLIFIFAYTKNKKLGIGLLIGLMLVSLSINIYQAQTN